MASLTLSWLHVVALLGAVQGVFLTGVLATKRRNRTANRLLAALMLAFSIGLATAVYHAAGLVPVYPHLFGFAYPLPFLYGPLVYLYAVHAADRNRALAPRDALHLAPFIAVVLFGLPIYLMSGAEKIAFHQQLLRGEFPPLIAIADPLKFVSGIAYAAGTMVFLLRHRERVKESYSSTERVNLRWLFWIGLSAAGIWGLAVAFSLLEAAGLVRFGVGDDLVALAVAAFVYSIGYLGLRQPEIFRYETAEHPVTMRSSETQPERPTDAASLTESEVPTSPRYERSGLSNRDAARLRDALLATMDRDEPWRDSDLTLADLAERLHTTPHKLSEVLNSEIGQTFYDLVNTYRVREVQRRIAAGEARALKILSLALDAGFASKSTFNQVFKKHTSQTPSDFRQAIDA